MSNSDLLDVFFYGTLTLICGLGARYFFYKQAIKNASRDVEIAQSKLLEENRNNLEKGDLNQVNSISTPEGSGFPTPEFLNSLCEKDEACSFAQKMLTEFTEALPVVEDEFFFALKLGALYLCLNNLHLGKELQETKRQLQNEKRSSEFREEAQKTKMADRYQSLAE